MVPDCIPGVGTQVSELLVVGLAGKDASIWLYTHIVESGSATLDPQFQLSGVKLAVLCGGIPDQTLVVLSCFVPGQVQ